MEHATPMGTWRVAWECLDEDHLRVFVTVPFGCEAEVALPHATESAYHALGGRRLAAGSYEVTYRTNEPLRRAPSIDWPLRKLMGSPDTESVVRRYCYHPERVPADGTRASMTLRELAPTLARGGGPLSEADLASCERELLQLSD